MSFLLVAGFATLIACSSDDEAAPRNGVDDVLKACQIRATWKNATSDQCINCVSAAPEAHCECELFKDFSGACSSQNDARRADPSCTAAMEDCSRACPKTDCGCVEACYSQAEQCKRLVAARDGCVADVCATYCQ